MSTEPSYYRLSFRLTLCIFEKIAAENETQIELTIESPPVVRQNPDAAIGWISPYGWRDVAGEYLKFAYYGLFY